MKIVQAKHWFLWGIVVAGSSLGIAEASDIVGVTVNPSTARITSPVGVNIKITVHADDNASTNCGLQIDYGGGLPPRDVKIDNGEGLFPRAITQQFTHAGTYVIRVQGKRVTTHLPCSGKASAVLVIENAPLAKPVVPAPAPVNTEQKFFRSWF